MRKLAPSHAASTSTDHGVDGTTVIVLFEDGGAAMRVHMIATKCPYTPHTGPDDRD